MCGGTGVEGPVSGRVGAGGKRAGLSGHVRGGSRKGRSVLLWVFVCEEGEGRGARPSGFRVGRGWKGGRGGAHYPLNPKLGGLFIST